MIDKKRLDGLLFAIMGDGTLVDRWWNSPNGFFEGQPPAQVLDQDPQRVCDYILKSANLNTNYQ